MTKFHSGVPSQGTAVPIGWHSMIDNACQYRIAEQRPACSSLGWGHGQAFGLRVLLIRPSCMTGSGTGDNPPRGSVCNSSIRLFEEVDVFDLWCRWAVEEVDDSGAVTQQHHGASLAVRHPHKMSCPRVRNRISTETSRQLIRLWHAPENIGILLHIYRYG